MPPEIPYTAVSLKEAFYLLENHEGYFDASGKVVMER